MIYVYVIVINTILFDKDMILMESPDEMSFTFLLMVYTLPCDEKWDHSVIMIRVIRNVMSYYL